MNDHVCVTLKNNKEYEAAIRCFLELENQGIDVNYDLGVLYGFTDKSVTDHEKAIHYLNRACEKKHPEALNLMGFYLEREAEQTGDYRATLNIYIEAISFGSSSAIKNLEKALITQQKTSDPKKIEKIMCVLLMNAGLTIQNQSKEKTDIHQALKLYETAATFQYPRAYTKLSMLYFNNEAVGIDLTKAFEYGLKGAELGDEIAMNNVGWFYQKGIGTQKDDDLAKMWYESASEYNYAESMYMLSTMYEDGSLEIDHNKSNFWLEKAAALNHEKALEKLNEKRNHHL